ncbi:MAG: hypothetical protein VX672_00415, partial [Planctomycetota bacterium]|nr:hypothetical protein [Planctomycetota bacterium]
MQDPHRTDTEGFGPAAGRVAIYALLGLIAVVAFLPIAYMLAISTGGAEPSAPLLEGGIGETARRTADNYSHVLT